MTLTSHRLKIEEKKALRRLASTLMLLFLSILFFIFIGLPLLAKIIATFSLNEKTKIIQNNESFLILPPTLDPLVEATNSAAISVSGFAQKEAAVKIIVNGGEEAKTRVDSEGRFLANDIVLAEGKNAINAVTLLDDRESSHSYTLYITYFKKPPKLEILSPNEGQRFSSEAKEIKIIGETDPGNKVFINDRFVIVNQEGKFSFPTTLNSGDNLFKITASDIAGNQTIIERKVTFTP